jgi:RHS repeat-associated protein
MKKLLYIIAFFPIFVVAQSPDQNWVKSIIPKGPTESSIPIASPLIAVTQVTYFDGLGRPIQQVAFGQSNSGKDIVTHIEYDAFGRQTKEFLPYANQNSSLYYNVNANTEVINFYNTQAYENTPNPFSEKLFEASPLNRISKQAAPGLAWKLDSGHEIKMDYQTNTNNEVKKFIVTSTFNNTTGVYDNVITESGYFLPNQLFKTVVKDEHWMSYAGNSNCTQEFKNKEGQIVLKRVFGGSMVGNTVTQTNHDTYYVYDIRGNLAYVLPPLVTSANSQLEGLCYQYKYDARNRLIEKKLPGKQWEYIVYDKLDRVVATGPAYNPYGGSDTNKGWLITKYDVFNRPVYTGWYNVAVASSANRKTLQDTYNNATVFSESKTTSANTINSIATKYTNQVSPSVFILLTVNYYDSYDYPNAPTIPAQIEGQNTQSTNLKGMPTGSWVRVLDNPSSTINETSYTVYDTRYRPIRSYTKNYLGGYTQVDTKLDWAGKTLYTLTSQRRTTSSELFTVKDRFEYSPQDRLTKHVQQLTSPTLLPEQLLTLNTYDELGKLASKKVGGTDVTGAQALQAVDYSYNIRGWLKAINDVNTLGTDLFAFKINYNQKENGTEGLFNGNITETLWRTSADNIKRKYNYSYDNLNRLLQANYSKPDASTNLNNYKEWLNYDPNGNITDIVRTGFMDPVAGTVENVIDNLKFVYDTASQNRLLKVNDVSNSPQGFKDNYASTENDFSYDNNGNMTADNNKGIRSILYNHLNLPIKINFGAKGEITYLYNAIGQKVQKFVKDMVSNTNTTTDYLSGFQYLNNTLQFFPHAEGYMHYTRPLNNGQLGSFNYVFNYTDHLGNVRVSFAKDPQQGNVLKILEENHYYAFGMKHENYNVTRVDFKRYPDTGVELVPMPAVANASYNVKYNGKELQEELGLNMTAMDFRQYDSAIGRFVCIDRLSELTPSITPYRFAFNSPNIFSDPTGLKEDGWVNTGDEVFWDKNVDNQDDVDRLYKGKGYDFNAIGTEVIDANGNTRILEDKGIASFKIEEVLVTGKAKKSTNNSKDYLGLSFSSTDVSLGTHNDFLYNHKTYPTTKGIEKNIFKPNGEVRSLQAGKYLKYSKYVKGSALIGSAVSTGYAGYKISNGTATTIDYVDGGVGGIGILTTSLSYFGVVSATVSNPVGWAVGGYGAIRLLQDLLEGYEPKGNGVGVFYDHNIGTYSIK